MEFNNILLDNIETPINITFSTPWKIFSNSTEKHSSKNVEHDDSQILKIENYIKEKYDEVTLDHLRQKITEEVNAKLSKIPKKSPDHTKLSLMKSLIDRLENKILFLREEIRQKNLLITSLISLRSTREPIDQQCELNNKLKTTDNEKSGEQKSSKLLINCEKKVNETQDKIDQENVCIYPPLLMENRISNIPDITDNKTSTNRNTRAKISNQRENSITERSKKLAFVISDSMVKDADGYFLTGSLNRKYIVKVRHFSSAKASDIEYYIKPTKGGFDQGIYILHIGTN